MEAISALWREQEQRDNPDLDSPVRRYEIVKGESHEMWDKGSFDSWKLYHCSWKIVLFLY